MTEFNWFDAFQYYKQAWNVLVLYYFVHKVDFARDQI